MDADKMAKIQLQVRENQAEVKDFLRDMDSWETDMKRKDEELKKGKSDKKQVSLPPVRNSLLKKKKKKKKAKPDVNVNQHSDSAEEGIKKRIKAYDYRSWDKFDVDKACEEVEEGKKSSGSSSGETDEEWEAERCQQQAIMLKDQGNRQFKEGRLDEAVESYTRGMMLDPHNALLPANRAMALLKQDKLAAAESDCTTSVSLDPTYIKAYLRRGTARQGMKKFEEARKDFQHVLKLEPNNKQAKLELEKIEKILNPPVDEESGIVKPIFKKPSERSKKPLMRIEIEEIGADEVNKNSEIANVTAKQSKITQEITAKENKIFEQFTQEKSDLDKKAGTEVSSSKSSSVKEEGNKAEEYIAEHADPSKLDLKELSDGQNKKPKKEKSDGSTGAEVSSPVSPRVPSVPSTSFQFQSDWKILRNHPEKFFQYFKEIDPAQFVKLFGQALDADILMMVLNTLHNFYLPASLDVYPVLENLAKVKRFSMTVMFMSSKEKTVLQEVFTSMKSSEKYATSEVDSLAKKYEL